MKQTIKNQISKFALFLFIALATYAEAGTTKEVFQRYLNPIFIETGSFFGDSIDRALEAGFKEVHSIELSPYLYEVCRDRFRHNHRVHLHLGNSPIVLLNILNQIDEPVTFWLDGHYSKGITARGETNTPLLEELAAIATHPIKTHTLLIDDVRLFGTDEFDFIELEEILEAIYLINPNYNIYFEDGHVAQQDVLVATVN